MSKKIFLTIISITLLVAVLTGCGNKAGKMEPSEPGGIPGVPKMENIDKAFDSITTFAGLQSFYGGLQFDELNEELEVAMAAFCAQTNDDQIEYSEDGAGQIISKDKMNAAMKDLFGKEYKEITLGPDVILNSHIAILDDGSVDVGLGDWGLVAPKMEVLAVDKVNESDVEFHVNVRFYPYDYEIEGEDTSIPSFCCACTCVPDDNSRYGFIITKMSGQIVE